MLHEAAAYIEDRSGALHEVVFTPDEQRVYVDVVSTMGVPPEAHDRLMATWRSSFPGMRVGATTPSWVSGDNRVARACRAQ